MLIIKGIKLAAKRRLKYELDLDLSESELHPVERILYKASSDDIFEEYELDYIIFGQLNKAKKEINFNKDEIKDIEFFSESKLKTFIQHNKITPWFNLILSKKMSLYFSKLEREKMMSEANNSKLKEPNNLPLIKFEL